MKSEEKEKDTRTQSFFYLVPFLLCHPAVTQTISQQHSGATHTHILTIAPTHHSPPQGAPSPQPFVPPSFDAGRSLVGGISWGCRSSVPSKPLEAPLGFASPLPKVLCCYFSLILGGLASTRPRSSQPCTILPPEDRRGVHCTCGLWPGTRLRSGRVEALGGCGRC